MLLYSAVPVGAVSYMDINGYSYKRDVLFCYDLKLPESFRPENQGETLIYFNCRICFQASSFSHQLSIACHWRIFTQKRDKLHRVACHLYICNFSSKESNLKYHYWHATDGEVESFKLIPVTHVANIIRRTQFFKPNCSLVIIDFLFRHGYFSFTAVLLIFELAEQLSFCTYSLFSSPD